MKRDENNLYLYFALHDREETATMQNIKPINASRVDLHIRSTILCEALQNTAVCWIKNRKPGTAVVIRLLGSWVYRFRSLSAAHGKSMFTDGEEDSIANICKNTAMYAVRQIITCSMCLSFWCFGRGKMYLNILLILSKI